MSDVIFKENTDEFRREFEAALKYNTYKKEYEQSVRTPFTLGCGSSPADLFELNRS